MTPKTLTRKNSKWPEVRKFFNPHLFFTKCHKQCERIISNNSKFKGFLYQKVIKPLPGALSGVYVQSAPLLVSMYIALLSPFSPGGVCSIYLRVDRSINVIQKSTDIFQIFMLNKKHVLNYC
jgi:hypothetical protein